MKMDEVALMVSDADDGLRERLDQEIYAFNVAATGHADGRLLSIAVRGDGGELRAGLSGWTWGGCGYVEFLWVRLGDRGSGLGTRLLVTAEREM
jgi:GNAT superfamily N-acetyltransferase